jgi:hypothetical protein
MKIDQYAGSRALAFYGSIQPLFIRGLIIAVYATLFFLGTASAQAQGRFALHGSIHPGVFRSTLAPAGVLPASMSLAISLPLHNQSTLDATLADLYNPASPNYRQWLTADEFVAQYGPTAQDVAQVVSFAQKHGLTVTKIHSNRMIVDVTGPTRAVEEAFNVNMRAYQHPTEARTFFGPDTEPSVENGVPILAVEGLENFVLPHPNLVKANAVQANTTGSGPGGEFMGNDYRAAYAPGVSLNGSGQRVALFEFGTPCYPIDLTNYTSQAGISPVTPQYVLLDGVSSTPSGDTTEQTLDVEMIHDMAPAATIVYYVGNSAVDILNAIATDNTCKSGSSSWSVSPPPSTMSQILQQMQAQGQSMFDASGDSGYGSLWSGWNDNPNWTIVGGTSLTTSGPGGAWQSETGWSGSTGNISTTFAIPSWQQGINMTASGGSTTMRNTPDVSMVADFQNWITYNNGQSGGGWGGTSFAAPLWAGFMALVNQQEVANGAPTAGFINPAVYKILLGGPSYASDFHDITSGNNGKPCVPGYDLVTGIGAPTGQALINDLSGQVLQGYTYVAAQNATVNFSTPADLAFGVEGKYFYLYAQSGNITFNIATFGDPDPGVVKSGYYKPFLQCASENGSYTFTVPVEAAFGAQGKYFYNQGVSGTVTFSNAVWGGDPDFGVLKAGYFMPYTQCATEGQSYTFSSPTDVAFGANGKYAFLYAVTGTITFNNATFGDPNIGVFKAGYFRPTSVTPAFGLANASFETPNVGTSGYRYNPTGGSWTFSGDSGIQSNGSAWGAPTAPSGTQTAFLQIYNGANNGSISQTVSFSSAGTYTLYFESALRAYHNGAISFNVLVDGTVVGTCSPTSTTSFTAYLTSPFTITAAGNHTVQFKAVGTSVDSSVFIDTVSIQ